MLAVLTGGTGCIGRSVGKALSEQGYRVCLLTRNPKKAEALPWVSEAIYWQALDNKALNLNIKEPWVCINLQGENIMQSFWSQKFKNNIYDSRIQGTRKLVQWVAAQSQLPEIFIQVSSLSFYGEQGKPRLFLQKLAEDWESELKKLPSTCRRAILRLSYVMDPKGGFLKNQLQLTKFGLYFFVRESKKLYINWIHYKDLVRFFTWVINSKTRSEVYDVVSPEPCSLYEFKQALLKLSKVFFQFSLPLSFLQTVLGEMIPNLFINRKVLPTKALEQGFEFKYTSIEACLKNLIKKD